LFEKEKLEEIYDECNIESPIQKELANKLLNYLSVHKFFKDHKSTILYEKLISLLQGLVFLDLFNESSPKVLKYF